MDARVAAQRGDGVLDLLLDLGGGGVTAVGHAEQRDQPAATAVEIGGQPVGHLARLRVGQQPTARRELGRRVLGKVANAQREQD
jgi:hypothetical protein